MGCLAILVSIASFLGTDSQVRAAGSRVPGVLLGVACPAATSCFAVGAAWPGATRILSGGIPLIEQWNGRAWVSVSAPLPPGDTVGVLYGVSCSGPRFCMAVGFVADKEQYRTDALVEMWHGRAWTIATLPERSNEDGELISASCLGGSRCYAAGDYHQGPSNDNEYFSSPIAEDFNGMTWHVRSVPESPLYDDWLFGIDCTSRITCFAVGNWGGLGTSIERSVVDQWNGEKWTAAWRVSVPAGPHLVGVSCPGSRTCVVMASRAYNPRFRTVMLRWNGSKWSRRWSPNPAGGASGTCSGSGTHGSASFYLGISCLTGFTCRSDFHCYAVGQGINHHALTESWNGSAWSLEPVANPKGAAYSGLSAVTCAATLCIAVGASQDDAKTPNAPTFPLVEVRGSSGWRVVPSPAGP